MHLQIVGYEIAFCRLLICLIKPGQYRNYEICFEKSFFRGNYESLVHGSIHARSNCYV